MAADFVVALDSRLRGNDNLVLTLLVAESDPKDKEVFIRLVMNMLTGAGS
jgi:hypothetical protein